MGKSKLGCLSKLSLSHTLFDFVLFPCILGGCCVSFFFGVGGGGWKEKEGEKKKRREMVKSRQEDSIWGYFRRGDRRKKR